MEEIKNNWPPGIKRTKQRESVLFILQNAKGPLSATDICAKMEDKKGNAWLSTVYRILELFVKKGIAIRTNVMSQDMAVYEINNPKHKHYAICINCHKIIKMENCPMENFNPELEENGFHVLGHNLEIYGYCKDCAKLKK